MEFEAVLKERDENKFYVKVTIFLMEPVPAPAVVVFSRMRIRALLRIEVLCG